MPLPKINTPTFELTLPSTGKKIKYRPFLVREEKILIMAMESQDMSEITNAIVQILSDCILTKDVKVEQLATFDIEYLFLNVRAKSVGETVKVSLTCPDDEETQVEAEIPLDEIKVVKTRGHKNELKISDEIVVTMGYPTLDSFVSMNFTGEDTGVDQVFTMAANCIKTIADPEQVYDCADVSMKELMEFFDSMDSKQFQMIQNFFETMPKLSHKVNITNPNTGVESEVVLEGLASFFA